MRSQSPQGYKRLGNREGSSSSGRVSSTSTPKTSSQTSRNSGCQYLGNGKYQFFEDLSSVQFDSSLHGAHVNAVRPCSVKDEYQFPRR